MWLLSNWQHMEYYLSGNTQGNIFLATRRVLFNRQHAGYHLFSSTQNNFSGSMQVLFIYWWRVESYFPAKRRVSIIRQWTSDWFSKTAGVTNLSLVFSVASNHRVYINLMLPTLPNLCSNYYWVSNSYIHVTVQVFNATISKSIMKII